MERALPFPHLVCNPVKGIPPSVDCRAFVSSFDQTVDSRFAPKHKLLLFNDERIRAEGESLKVPFHRS
jgi:hypothetical protein